jgi:RsiW-degrading membrane proteinase PrsW (M82 family)
MIRVVFAFVLLAIAFHFAIQIFRSFTGKEKWEFIKTFGYAMGLSVVVIAFMIGIVILF